MIPTSQRDERTLSTEQRELLRGLARGVRLSDLGWALDASPERVRELASDALATLGGPPPDALSGRERNAVADYLLGRQVPGQAAGTWALLEESEPALEWAGRLCEGLAAEGHDPPPLPGGGGASPADRARDPQRAPSSPLARRRRQRERQRTQANVAAAAAEIASPFRGEALQAQRDADERVKLPHFASRPARLTLYVLLVALLGGLAMSIFVRIPTHTAAIVFVTSVPAAAPVPENGMVAIGLFDSTSGARLRIGQTLRVQLPDTKNRVSMRVTRVLSGIRSPREIAEGFALAVGQANRLTSPAIVVVAKLSVPAGRRPASFEGAVTEDADARTGDRRIISLLDVF